MRVEWGCDDLVIPWLERKLDLVRGFGPAKGAAVLTEAGDLAAGVVFHNYHPEAGVIEVSAAALNARWAQRGVLKELLGYAFGPAQCQAVVARCSEDNNSTRRLWRGMGAQEFILPRLRGRDESECVHILTDDAWASCKLSR